MTGTDTHSPRSQTTTKVSLVDLSTVLAKLYDSEINCRLSSVFDDGWHVELGDDANEIKAETTTATLAEPPSGLTSRPASTWPQSEYATGHSLNATR